MRVLKQGAKVPREILTTWRTDAGSSFVSVMYFSTAGTVANQRTALAAFWTAADGICAGTTTWTIDTDGRELDTASGSLTGAWTETSVKTGAGGGAGDQSGDALQGLVRWHTGAIVNGRFLQGRNFIPGLAATAIVDGNLSAAAITIVQNAANTFLASGEPPSVWHRPVSGSGGALQAATSASVWAELAVLRRRRG
jgi:hypothetical protein